MGGGDLNSKKSWHPNTIKNQERVWKAEQAAVEEKKRIVELQRERAQERDRAELNDLAQKTAGAAADDRLSWMYTKPDKKGNQEEYLLGKTIDSNYDRPDREQPGIPAVARRVVGSSMLAAGGDSQVDLVRKMREDPLLLVKERERAARAALLNNPLQRRKLTELLRKEQEQRKEKKSKNSKKNDLDDKLAEKLNALGGKKGIDLAALLASGESSSESSSSDEKSKKKKKKKKKSKSKKKSKKKTKEVESDDNLSVEDVRSNERQKANFKQRNQRDDNSSDEDVTSKRKRERSPSQTERQRNHTQSYSNKSRDREDRDNDRNRYENPERTRDKKEDNREYYREGRRDNPKRFKNNREERGDRFQADDRGSKLPKRQRTPSMDRGGNSKGMTAEERAARLAEMARAGEAHEKERGVRVAHQRAAIAAEDAQRTRPGASGREARALPTSLESRIHSNRHNIQRSERHMNEHFARR